ncbi:hypothetical protein ACQKRQ_38345 [Paraburkholderia sp. NPDC080076]|uniref:hypothetical protein n=1 Tax=Paraburkholderia sp. NPDC080076 TaxID=3390605 RepID=UPI003CFEF11F
MDHDGDKARCLKEMLPSIPAFNNNVTLPPEGKMKSILFSLAGCLVLAACSAGNVEQAAGNFHNGYTDATKTIANRTAALISAERTKSTFNRYGNANSVQPGSQALNDFAGYVCMSVPHGLDSMKAGLSELHQASLVVDPDNIKADKSLPGKIKGILDAAKDFEPLKASGQPTQADDKSYCEAVVAVYMSLSPKDLPSMSGNEAEPVGAFAFTPALAIVTAAWKAMDATLGILEEQARAEKLKRYIRDQRTQDNVRNAFEETYLADVAARDFCENRKYAILCAASVSKAPPPSHPEKGGTGQDASKADTSRRACFAEIDQTLFTVPDQKTILDSITIEERWSNLRLAWYNFYALDQKAGGVNGTQQRQALDQAVSDYLTVPATADVAGSIVQAWAKLTYMANGCLTDAEAFGELKVFAENANAVYNSAKSVSDAKDKYDTASAAAKNGK